jgi:MFS family permease
VRFRLSLLMLLQYLAPGAVCPLFSARLQEMGFSPTETADCCATQALGTLLAPLLAGQIADRWLSAERFLFVCSTLAGIDLWVLAGLHTPGSVFVAMLVFWLLYWPATMLGATVAFTHLKRPDREYGPVRMWGTLGWMLAGWVVTLWFSEPAWLRSSLAWLRPDRPASDPGDFLRLGAVFEFFLAAYAWTLPPTPPDRRAPHGAAPIAALRLLAGPAFAIFGICYVGVSLTLSFTSQGTPLLLEDLGLPHKWLPASQTIAQVTEVLSLPLLPMFLLRFGVRGTMILGLGSWLAALVLLAIGRPLGLVLGSLVFNGLLITGFMVAGQVFVNRSVGPGLRASAQGLLTFINGLGMLLGHKAVGWVREAAGGELPPVFRLGASLIGVLLVLFLTAFRDPKEV